MLTITSKQASDFAYHAGKTVVVIATGVAAAVATQVLVAEATSYLQNRRVQGAFTKAFGDRLVTYMAGDKSFPATFRSRIRLAKNPMAEARLALDDDSLTDEQTELLRAMIQRVEEAQIGVPVAPTISSRPIPVTASGDH